MTGTLVASGGCNKAAMAVLVFCTLVFAINAFNLFSLFYLIAEEFNADVSLLGMISAAMVIGIGLILIPAGILAAKYGPRKVAIIGLLIIAGSSTLIGVSTDIYQIAALRFVLGGGMAFFFPSAIVLGAQHFRKGSEGLGSGIIVGSNAAGGVLGLVLWAVLASIVGWRTGILAGAALAAIAAIAMYFVLPGIAVKEGPSFNLKASHIRALITDKFLIIMGITLLGSQAAFEQTLAFMPFYLQEALAVEPAVAGLVGSFALISALAGSLITGWLYDKKLNTRVLILVLAAFMLAGISLNYLQTLAAAVASAILVGFVGGGLFTLLSNAGRERVATGQEDHYKIEYATFSLNWMHAIALTGTFWAPILFSSIAIRFGYSTAWPLIGVLSFGIILAAVIIGFRVKEIIRR